MLEGRTREMSSPNFSVQGASRDCSRESLASLGCATCFEKVLGTFWRSLKTLLAFMNYHYYRIGAQARGWGTTAEKSSN